MPNTTPSGFAWIDLCDDYEKRIAVLEDALAAAQRDATFWQKMHKYDCKVLLDRIDELVAAAKTV